MAFAVRTEVVTLDDGGAFTIRQASGRQLRAARYAANPQLVKAVHAYFADASKGLSPMPEYDSDTLLLSCIVSWTDGRPVTPVMVAALNTATRKLLVTKILTLSGVNAP